MFEIDKIPVHIRRALADKGVAWDAVYLTAYCDMDRGHTYCDTYLVATADTLYILSGTVGLVSRENRAKGGLDPVWNESEWREYPLSELKDLRLEELLSGARLTAKT